MNDKDKEDKRKDIVVLKNVHKTYLLGVEGVTALRGFSFENYIRFIFQASV